MGGHKSRKQRTGASETEVYPFAFPAALVFARLAAQARSNAFLQAAVIFRFCLGFSLACAFFPALAFAHLASRALANAFSFASLTAFFLGASAGFAAVDIP